MKILLLSDSYSPMVNGVVTSVRTLQSGLIAQGHDVRVITPGDARTSSFDGDVYRLASIGIGAIYPGARLARPTDRKVLTSICEWGPDILHSHTEFTAYLWARRLTRHTNAPHVHTYHTVYEDYTHYFSPSEKVGKGAVAIGSRHMMGATDLVISPTRKVKGLLDGYGVTTPVAVIPTGINLTRFTSSLGHTDLATTNQPHPTSSTQPAAPNQLHRTVPINTPTPTDAHTTRPELHKRLGINENETVILYVGRLAQEKGLVETFNLLNTLPEEIPWRFVVVGDGPYASNLHQQAHRMGLNDKVIFTGAVDPEYVCAFYRIGDIFVSSSRSETQGLTYLEALASELPILCAADPVLDDLVTQGVNGYQYHSPEEFTDRMTELLTNPKLRTQLGQEARATALNHSETAFVHKIIKAYEEVIDRRRISPRIGRVA